MRITLDLDEELLSRAKKAAADRGTTLDTMIEDALSEKLTRSARLRAFKGDGLQPGVELSSTAALLDLLDGDAG